ncbi:poly(A) polymerase [Exophiala viscosa]|uniref:poly(A) polymerase n=1 Tax=Exophiala viscosa TaxID=2486360 RepID=UPI00219B6D01|nr:poly(A) polymerase [Exophiala viscosa]
MEGSEEQPGFTGHVWSQLQSMSQQSTPRGRGHRGGHRGGRHTGRGHGFHQHHHMNGSQASFFSNQQSVPSSNNSEDFPPLGAPQQAPSRNTPFYPQSQPQHQYQPQYQHQPPVQQFDNFRHGTPREFQDRARGHHRGHPGRYGQPPHIPATAHAMDAGQYANYGRPPPRHAQLYQHNPANYGTAEQQRNMRHILMSQSDYLNEVGRKAYGAHKLSREESLLKENFRKDLESVAKEALTNKYPDIDAENIKLKCYGSLANGFALAGCDMDLLLSLPEYQETKSKTTPPDVENGPELEQDAEEDEERVFNMEIRRVLEKAFLDKEYGARLLENTRVPILRICERPSPELLHNLCEYRASWEKSSFETPADQPITEPAEEPDSTSIDAVNQALSELEIKDLPSPMPATRGNADLEFKGDCGIQCDINFANFVAMHNSTLLKLYQSFDPRVGDVGIFVKIWAKARDINTPYRGTLSSYGYILLVLHYLMNIASPPVIPNLQYLAKLSDGWNPDKEIPLFEGFDIRFIHDPDQIKALQQEMAATKNRETSSQLLRGFFRYYATREGFHWTRDVISIRQRGGLLSKSEKGWTEAKWAPAKKHVRLRYLLSIEDPFEVEHNVGRTVGHHGLVSIRDEFRRAWSILEKVGNGAEISVDEFLEPVTDRVDTLRKDQQFHKQKVLDMKQELELKEKLLMQKMQSEDPGSQNDGTSGNSDHGIPQAHSSSKEERRSPDSQLTSTHSHQDIKMRKRKSSRQISESWRLRKVSMDSDDEEEDSEHEAADRAGGSISPKSNAPQPGGTGSEGVDKANDFFCSRKDVLLANGLDQDGNPVAWDIDTQEGRWLHWRDTKISKGTMQEFSNPTLRELNEQCPYDPNRPSPYSTKQYRSQFERMRAEQPPWPANSENSSIPDSAQPASHPRQAIRVVAESLDARQSRPHEESHVDTTSDTPQQPRDNKVGKATPWDNSTRGGRWLRSRDKHLREGTWRHHLGSKNLKKLSNEFPYNELMTWEELEEKNELLRKYYSKTIHPRELRGTTASNDAAAESTTVYGEKTPSKCNADQSPMASDQTYQLYDNPIARQTDPVSAHHQQLLSSLLGRNERSVVNPRSVHTEQPQEPEPAASPAKVRSQASGSDRGALRARRLAFFAKQFTSPQSDAGPTGNAHFFAQTPGKTSLDVPVSGGPGEPRTEQSMEPFAIEEKVKHRLDAVAAVEEADNNGARSDDPPDDPHENAVSQVQDSPVECLPVEVPATLYPDTVRGQRPRDEDPDIMPIPRKFGFHFDPRQLQDLAIIAKGGNGCAREGAEFNIEDEYEWGGGGMMGWRTSTGYPYGGVSGGRTPYEAGRGDEEGLLNELPGELD